MSAIRQESPDAAEDAGWLRTLRGGDAHLTLSRVSRVRDNGQAVHKSSWNHNIHYHDIVLRSVPHGATLALDVGCGQGLLARQLARCCQKVIAIDADCSAIAAARAATATVASVTFIAGDVMTRSFANDSFDLVTAVAALHHLQLRPALARFRDFLKPGGVLVVIGLYRAETLGDYAICAAGFPASWALRLFKGHADVGAPVQDPRETLREIRSACHALLPNAVLRRRLLFRYSLIWRKP